MKPWTTGLPCLPHVLALLILLAALPALAAEEIRRYDIEIEIHSDGSLGVTEHITIQAEGSQIRRGLYRDFPTRYRDRHGNRVVVGFEVLGVERDGLPEPWFTESLHNGVRINTGNDDFLPTLPGEYRYTLRYRTTRQLGFFAAHDELYWNAIGTGWIFPILTGTVEVRLPQAVPVDAMTLEAYTGPQGAQGRDYSAAPLAPGVARWSLTRALAPYEGLTIVLGFPKGLVAEPSTGQRVAWLLQDNRGILVALAGIAVLLTYCARRWRAVGRDPRPGVIIARYEPPKDRSPAELRYLCRSGYDTRCFTADLLTLAVGGHLLIERENRVLFKDRWTLERQTPGEGAPAHRTASALLANLFGPGRQKLEMKQDNASQLQRALKAHTSALETRLHGSHFNRNGASVLVAAAIALATGVTALGISGGGGIEAILVLCAAMLTIVLVFRKLVMAPTPEGRRLIDEAEGLKRYLGVAERDELKNIGGPGAPPPLDAQRYEALLPYAIALDVEEAWTKKFTAAVGIAAAATASAGIRWVRGGGFSDLGGLANAIGIGLNASIASASTPPGSSSGGGGGSSGGGGGGGGGGGR